MVSVPLGPRHLRMEKMVLKRPSSGGAREVVVLAQVCSGGQGGMETARMRAMRKSYPARD